MFILKLCFSFSGRINRAKYWLGLGIASCLAPLADFMARRSWQPEILVLMVFGILALLFYFVALVTAVKRLHDLNISGWWACGALSAFLLTLTFLNYAAGPKYLPALTLVLFACMIWLGSAQGAERENRFGPVPIPQKKKSAPATTAAALSNEVLSTAPSPSPVANNGRTRRTLFWLWISVSAVWLVTGGWMAANNWSGDGMSSREYLLLYERPASWGDQHPECRDKFGYWPDGSRMDASEFSEYADVLNYILRQRGITRTPQQEARDEWAHNVRQKVASCEAAQWMPIVRSAAITKERIGLVAFALLPPVIIYIAFACLGQMWTLFGKSNWLRLSAHIRRGFIRLYFAVVIPWIIWFGYRFYDAGSHHYWAWRATSHAFWLLLIAPIGGPISLLLIVWVLAGFSTLDPEAKQN